MYGNDRAGMRRVFVEAWAKGQAGQPLGALEALVVELIALHPEYQGLMSSGEAALEREFPPEAGVSNPFIHLGMHLGLREQIQADRPAGIRAIHARLLATKGDPHATDHAMMECLGEALWQAQREGHPPDDVAYLTCLRRLLES